MIDRVPLLLIASTLYYIHARVQTRPCDFPLPDLSSEGRVQLGGWFVRAEGRHERLGQRHLPCAVAEAAEALELLIGWTSAVEADLIADPLALQLLAQFGVGVGEKIPVLLRLGNDPSVRVLRLRSDRRVRRSLVLARWRVAWGERHL